MAMGETPLETGEDELSGCPPSSGRNNTNCTGPDALRDVDVGSVGRTTGPCTDCRALLNGSDDGTDAVIC